MHHTWQLQEAKSKFSKLVDSAIKEGPQIVSRHGLDTVVVISVHEYNKFVAPKESLSDFLKRAPKVELDIQRQKDMDRKIRI